MNSHQITFDRDDPPVLGPALVVTGAKDPIVPPVNARILDARIPDATVHVVPDAGHLLPMDPGRPLR